MYSIIDIEASGGKYGEEKIIEIAIYKYDGEKLVDQFSTLVNPEKNIDDYVQKLTGITDKMVKRAPKFPEIAKRVVQILKDSVLVAHNADFDYRMLRQEFKTLGYPFTIDFIDTIMLSEYLLPQQETYGLKNLTKSLGIQHLDAHRAHGDALATLELFKILLQKDQSKSIVEKSINNKLYLTSTPKLIAILEDLPHTTGVYYIHNINGKIIFIGTAKDIYNQLHHTFMHDSFLAKKIQNKTDKISYESTGSLLLAKIKYLDQKRVLNPKLNKYEKRKRIKKDSLHYPEKDMILYDKGHIDNEKVYFLIRDNQLKGYGHFTLQSQIDSEEKLMNRLTPIEETPLIKKQVIEFYKKRQKATQ